MDPVRLVKLERLMSATSGHSDIVVGVIDGPVDVSHPDLHDTRIEALSPPTGGCQTQDSLACRHGTFVLGVLGAARASQAPAICPACPFLVRSIFCETSTGERSCPQARPRDLVSAMFETVEAGARVINLSMGLDSAPQATDADLDEAFDFAFRRGVLVVVASGNQGRVGRVPLLAHPWAIPVVASDAQGQLHQASNLGHAVGRRGLAAPGRNVLSLSPGGGYSRMSGTSVAAPFVTGFLALLWSLHPTASAAEIRCAALLQERTRRSVVPPLLDAEASARHAGLQVHKSPASQRDVA